MLRLRPHGGVSRAVRLRCTVPMSLAAGVVNRAGNTDGLTSRALAVQVQESKD